MRETLKMMKSIMSGKEKNREEIQLINEYKQELYPNILAYFYCNNFGMIENISKLYPIINDNDKASFCLEELDKSLQLYDENKNVKFTTYFSKMYKNRLRMETEQLLTQKRKIMINYKSIDEELTECDTVKSTDFNEFCFTYIYESLDNTEKKYFNYLYYGYTINELSKILKVSVPRVYQINNKLKNKILNLL